MVKLVCKSVYRYSLNTWYFFQQFIEHLLLPLLLVFYGKSDLPGTCLSSITESPTRSLPKERPIFNARFLFLIKMQASLSYQ
jgi:hypothetical protein